MTCRAINTAFALIGLHLALDEGRSGIDVRDTHQRLAAPAADVARLRAGPRRAARRR